MIILAISNQKGGVGKTTTTQHMAAVLGAEHHSRVLAVDLDPQFNLTKAAGVDVDHLTASVYQVLVTQAATLRDVIQPTEQGYDIAPADPRLGSADIELVSAGRVNWHLALRKALATLGGSYDWVLLDCPPALGTLTVNALHAAHGVVIPVTPELWPISGMQLLFIGVLGEYLGRIYEEVKLRPRYIVARRLGGTLIEPANDRRLDASELTAATLAQMQR